MRANSQIVIRDTLPDNKYCNWLLCSNEGECFFAYGQKAGFLWIIEQLRDTIPQLRVHNSNQNCLR